MAVIPKVLDYGAQPSLRTSRIDLPGQGELAIADAVVVAADTFSSMMIDSKEKTDAFNYSMRVKEYQSADLQQREKLKDDREYEKFDEKYTGGMKLDGDRIAEKYPLPARDAALFDAEAALIHARGRSSVQEFRRVIEIDDNLAKLDGALELTKEEVQIASPGEANALLTNALDLINAAEEKLWLSDVQAQKKREDLVQTVSYNKLKNMDPKVRQEILEGSLKYRKEQGPITVDAIRKGEGTGYIADFLHTDTAKAMLEETKKENEIDTAQAEGYASKDKAWAENPGLGSGAMAARAKEYRTSGLSPEARKAAEAADAREIVLQDKARQEDWRQIDGELWRMARDFDLSWEELSGGLRSKLETQAPAMAKSLEARINALRAQEDYPGVTSSEAVEAYAELSAAEKAEWDADEWMVPTPMREPKRWGDNVSRKQADLWKMAAAQKKEAIAAGKVPETGLPQMTLGDKIFGTVMKKPTAGDELETHKKWNRMWLAYHNAAIREGGEDKLTPEQRTKLMNDVIIFEVFERETFMWIDAVNPDNPAQFATMTSEQIQNSYLPLNHPVPPYGFTASTMQVDWPDEGVDLPAYSGTAIKWLRTTGSTLNGGVVPDDKELEEAWFYLVTQGRQAAYNRLAGLPGY